MDYVRPKKHLGQHFLRDENIAQRIVDSLSHVPGGKVLEIGPGTGVLTKYLLTRAGTDTWVIELDAESVAALEREYPKLQGRILHEDFLKFDPRRSFDGPFSIIGNFPYNISTQIMFRLIEMREQVPEVVGMFQKEVAQRLAAKPGGRQYGILSVLLKAWYDIEYLFEVSPGVFHPPPKVHSAVIRLKRNSTRALDCDEALFVKVVKAGFNQRRKTLRNALKVLPNPLHDTSDPVFDRRAETLSVAEFEEITRRFMSGL